MLEKVLRTDLDAKKNSADIAFHLTDWADDLEEFYEYLSDPKKYSVKEANRIIHIFLQHATHHIVAAFKLYTGDPVNDVFEIGAVKEEN